MRASRVTGADVALGDVQLRLVREVADHAGLSAGAKQRALRALEDLDAFEVGGIDVEVAAGQLSRLLIQIDRNVGKAADDASRLGARIRGGEPSHDDVVLRRAGTGQKHNPNLLVFAGVEQCCVHLDHCERPEGIALFRTVDGDPGDPAGLVVKDVSVFPG